MKFLKPNSKKIIIKMLILIAISVLLTMLSFCFTNTNLNIIMYRTYFEPKLFFLNFLPILLIILLLYFISKRVHISFLITSLLIIVLGVANQTKITYRDDIVKFQDLFIIKEAFIMSQRYSIVIKKYTILAIILMIPTVIILKKYIPKMIINIKKQIVAILLIIVLMLCLYKFILTDATIYNSVGDTSLINIWITTRQYQIRGLVYPFIYTIEDGKYEAPEGYNENEAKSALERYTYENIDENKKVNVIAIMLEAYNDFSKFNAIDFNEDIYKNFHDIQKKSISGNLLTTIFGGGTVVTERNFITGFDIHPTYRKATNSYVWYFKEQGYRTEAMHPMYGAFYNRASINPNLGFDNYFYYENKFADIQSDFMQDYDFFDYIIEGYNNAKSDNIPYFNFSVTYQNHGPYYDKSYIGKEYFFDNNNYDEDIYNMLNEYFYGIKKTDKALKKLIDYFEGEEEPVIVILFGDHNPYLGENNLGYEQIGINLDLSTIEGFENYYEIPYIIYANETAKEVFDKEFIGEGETISPIFLMNQFFDYVGLKGNNYMQYMSDLKSHVDVISDTFYKENDEFINKNDSIYQDMIDEYKNVNYYYSKNFIRKVNKND